MINSAVKDGTFLNHILSGDKAWCFVNHLQLKQQLLKITIIANKEETMTGQVKKAR
jgi:hypothetical protein